MLDIRDTMVNILKQRDPHPKVSHYPSEILSCSRQIYYTWKAIDKTNPVDDESILKMKMGENIHELVYESLLKQYPLIQKEVEVKYKHPELKNIISGRIDVYIPEEQTAIEIKSTYLRGFTLMKKEGKPKDEHVYQAISYLFFNNIDIKKIILFYLARDTASSIQYELELRDGVIYLDGSKTSYNASEIVKRFKNIEMYTESETEPIKDPQLPGWACGYCSYKEYCEARQ